MSKKPRGHYCRICGQHKANEKFSGCGHAAHICKACAKRGNKPPDIKDEPLVFIDDDDIDISDYIVIADEEPREAVKKRKSSKEKLLRASQKKTAKTFLSKMLENGEVASTEVREAAAKAGIPTEALHRAKGSLGIRAVAAESGGVWKLPRQKKQTESNADSANGGT